MEENIDYREELVFRVRAGIMLLNESEISDVIFASLNKYQELFPDWEIMLLTTKKDADPMITYSKLVELLQQHEKFYLEKKNNASR